MICGGCGAEISPGDETCPHCGIRIEYPGAKGAETAGGSVCPSCGHRNTGKGAFCESCGKRLGGAAIKTSKEGKKKSAARSGMLSGQHAPAILVAVVFCGWIVYSEVTREIPETQSHAHQPAETGHTDDPEIDRLQKIVDENPADDESLLRLANLLQDHSSHERDYLVRAITAYQKYLTRNPGSENARVDLGICYFEMSRTDTVHGTALIDRAIAEITTVAGANPRHQAAAFNLGIVTLNAGRTEEAETWFRRTVEIDPASELGTRAKSLLEQHTFSAPSE